MGNNAYDFSVNVMMVGGRRCGKTSVLAAMQSCFEDKLNDTPLYVRAADVGLIDVLSQKWDEMQNFFSERGTKHDFTPNGDWTEEIKTYPFHVGIKDKPGRIKIKFIDYPGEWLAYPDARKEHWEEIKQNMSKSRILLIAIDTPYMMEEKGKYNNARNLCRHITEMVKETEFADRKRGGGMVLFVPLKCERYYNQGQMDNMKAKVREAYKPLLDYLLQPGAAGKSSRIITAITPIITLGGAEFSRFLRDNNGDIEINDKYGTPAKAIYHFPDMSKDKPEPKFCEQPLLYILSFVLSQAEAEKESQKTGFPPLDFFLEWVQDTFFHLPSADDYLRQKDTIDRRKKCSGDGYILLNNGVHR